MRNWPTQKRLNVFYVFFVWLGICCFVCGSLRLFSIFLSFRKRERDREAGREREKVGWVESRRSCRMGKNRIKVYCLNFIKVKPVSEKII